MSDNMKTQSEAFRNVRNQFEVAMKEKGIIYEDILKIVEPEKMKSKKERQEHLNKAIKTYNKIRFTTL
ncbi:hypothetical protein NLX69_03880 [Rossellomorea sp. BNER]|nr:hypothetical protein [Rossellomorea sp. BNER]